MFPHRNPHKGQYRFPLCVTLLLLLGCAGAISNGNMWLALSLGLLASFFGFTAFGHYVLYRKEETRRKNQRETENQHIRQYRQFQNDGRKQSLKQLQIHHERMHNRRAQLHNLKSKWLN